MAALLGHRKAVALGLLLVPLRMTWSPVALADSLPPAAAAPAIAESASSHWDARTGQANVRFVSSQSGLTLHIWEEDDFGQEHFDVVCTAPCEAAVPTGSPRMGLSLSKRGPVEANPVTLHGPATLKGTYESRVGLRIALWGSAAVLVILGFLVVNAGLPHWQTGCIQLGNQGQLVCGIPQPTPRDEGLEIAGVTLSGIGLVLAIVPRFIRDKASIEVVPLSSSRVLPKGLAMEHLAFPASGDGVALRVKF